MADDFTLAFRSSGGAPANLASMVKQPIVFGDDHLADFYFVRGPRLAAVGIPDSGRYLRPETVSDPSSIRIISDSARDILCIEYVAGAGSSDGPTVNRDAVNVRLPNGSTLRANILTDADDLVVGVLIFSASEMTGPDISDYPAFLN
jgi:hypothetical protein